MNDPKIGDDEFVKLFADRERAAGQDTLAETASTDDDLGAAQTLPDSLVVRQEYDVALAALLLEEEVVNEQQLAEALSDWTIHGTESLGEHLVSAELYSDAECVRLRKKSQQRLNQITTEFKATLVTDSNVTDETIISLEQIDSSGRVATLLGMSSNPAAAGQNQKRRFSEDYTLIRKLGQGGLGTVWLARDNSLQRYVALKEVNEAMQGNPATVSRFSHEAVVTGRLEHPSIVPIHQFAKDIESGQTFYTMRFLGKQTMQDAIVEYHERREDGDHDPMLLHHLLSAFVSVCQAIAYAHSRNVVHRDLKPENIALDRYGQVIVLDWGLAKTIGESDLHNEVVGDSSFDQSHTHKTVAGQVMGTPMYMAPEQAAGRVDEIDERTDVYGLGAILFEILTGDPPGGRSHRSITSGSKVAELLTAIMNNPIPGARELNPDVAPELNAVCAKALARKLSHESSRTKAIRTLFVSI
jgi:eukaryotic-like serine/threonine-protein kinase